MSEATEFLRSRLEGQTQGIKSYRFNDQKVWVKKAMPRHGAWKYWPVSFFAWLTGASALKVVRNAGGVKSIQTEIRRLESLRKAGVRVPEVLATAETGFMLADMSSEEREARPLVKVMKRAESADECLMWMRKGAEALAGVHHKGCWLSEAFARNILVDGEGEIAFIDFETDPSDVLSFEACCVRDWMTFIYSCITPLERHDCLEEGGQLLQAALMTDADEIQQAVVDNTGRLIKLNRLRTDLLGRDSRSLYHSLEILAGFRAKT